jgi:hypothetical protein
MAKAKRKATKKKKATRKRTAKQKQTYLQDGGESMEPQRYPEIDDLIEDYVDASFDRTEKLILMRQIKQDWIPELARKAGLKSYHHEYRGKNFIAVEKKTVGWSIEHCPKAKGE